MKLALGRVTPVVVAALAFILVTALRADAQSYQLLHTFTFSTTDGAQP